MEVKHKKRNTIRQKPILHLGELPIFTTIGIVSSSALHKLAWQINEKCQWGLEVNVELSQYLQMPDQALVYTGKDKQGYTMLLLPPFVKTVKKTAKKNKNKLIFDYIIIALHNLTDEISILTSQIRTLPSVQFISMYPETIPLTGDWLVLM